MKNKSTMPLNDKTRHNNEYLFQINKSNSEKEVTEYIRKSPIDLQYPVLLPKTSALAISAEKHVSVLEMLTSEPTKILSQIPFSKSVPFNNALIEAAIIK